MELGKNAIGQCDVIPAAGKATSGRLLKFASKLSSKIGKSGRTLSLQKLIRGTDGLRSGMIQPS
jgi:hypothetical protein